MSVTCVDIYSLLSVSVSLMPGGWVLDGENCFKATYLTLKVMDDSHTTVPETCTLSVPMTVLVYYEVGTQWDNICMWFGASH